MSGSAHVLELLLVEHRAEIRDYYLPDAIAAAKGVGDLARAFEGCLEEVETSDELRSIWSLRDPASTGGEGLTSKL